MLIDYKINGYHLNFMFKPDKDDEIEYINKSNSRAIKLITNKCCFILPDNLNKIHNDLIAVSSILLILPFVKKKIEFNFSISKKVKNVLEKTGYLIITKNQFIEPRSVNINSVPSIAYSGGIDSTASLLLLPKNSVVIFLDRININNDNRYNQDSIYHVLDHLISLDYLTLIMKSDMEYLRVPIGFPTDIACGIPNILLSELLNINSIAYGYCNHHAEFLSNDIDYVCTGDLQLKYENCENICSNFSFWKELFNSISIGLNFNTMGITEISTSILIQKSPLNYIVSSCMRGNIDTKCNNCFKCFKSETIKLFLKNKKFNDNDIKYLSNIIKNEIIKPRYGKKKIEEIDSIKKIESFILLIAFFHSGKNKTFQRIKLKYQKYLNSFSRNMVWNKNSIKYADINYLDSLKIKLEEVDKIILKELD